MAISIGSKLFYNASIAAPATSKMPVRAPVSADRRSAADRQAAELLLALSRLARELRHDESPTMASLRERGLLAPRHAAALAVIALDGPLTVSELAERVGLALSTASLLVSQLADAGVVERREDETDRRRTVVSVAPDLRPESEAALEARLAPLRTAVVRMGAARARAMLEGLDILAEAVSPSDASRRCASGSAAAGSSPAAPPRSAIKAAPAAGTESPQ